MLRLSHTTVHILAKSGDAQAEKACKAWMSLVELQDPTAEYPVRIESWFDEKSDKVEVALVTFTPEGEPVTGMLVS